MQTFFSSTSSPSTSGILPANVVELNGRFTDFSEMRRMTYCRLMKAKRFGKWYVLKCLLPEHIGNTLYEGLLQKEAVITLQMDHQNIVKSYGWEQLPTLGNCLVLEYIEGISLSELLKQNPSTHIREKVVSELLSAMDYFHAKQITHRDLKPSNIMITHNGHNVKIIDFGLADADNYAILKQPAGTLRYMSPEQKDGTRTIDARSDLYSFGVILNQIFPHISAPIYRYASHRCLKDQPEDRFQNAESVRLFIRKAKQMLLVLPLALVTCTFFILLFFRQAHPSQEIITEVRHDTIRLAVQESQPDTIEHIEKPKAITQKSTKKERKSVNGATNAKTTPKSQARQLAHKQMTDYARQQLKPIDKRINTSGFLNDWAFKASLTNCYLFCQKQLQNNMANHISPDYPQYELYHDIDSTLGRLIVNDYTYKYGHLYPSFPEQNKSMNQRLEKDTTLTFDEKQEIINTFLRKHDEDIINYE